VNEVAFLRLRDGKTTEITGGGNVKNKVGLFNVNNYKQGTMQTMHVFPHIELWQLDFYFSLAVFWAISDGGTSEDDYAYPTFGENARKENEDNKKKSRSPLELLSTSQVAWQVV